MWCFTLLIIILQVRSISAMVMVFLTSPLGLIGVVLILLLFQQPLGTHSVFWDPLAYTLIGGTLAGTVLTLVFLPAMYSIWFNINIDKNG